VFLPCFEWIIGYDWRKNLVWDVLAGCSVGFMVVSTSIERACDASTKLPLRSKQFHDAVRRYMLLGQASAYLHHVP
jgi:hypothetical protein